MSNSTTSSFSFYKKINSIAAKIILPLLFMVAQFSTNAQTVLSAWEVSGLTGYGASPLTPASTNANLTVVGLTRGSGLTTGGTAASNAWGGDGYNATTAASTAITNNDFWTFRITANTGFSVSISSISAYNIRRSASGPATGQWQYQIGSGSFVDIGTAITWGTTTSAAGNNQAAITLSGIPALQNVAAGTQITFRLVGYNSTATTGTNYINNIAAGNDLIINGSVNSAVTNYDVLYNGNGNTGGTAPVDASSPYASGSNVTISGAGTLVRTGYTFTGWNTAANGSGTAYAAGATLLNITANTTLFAQWLINSYTVTYDGNGNDGGTAPSDGSSPYNFGSNVTVLNQGTLSLTGFSFNGWNTAANGSGTAYAPGATISAISANTTLYAQWIPANTYAVLYNGNGNTSGTPPVDGASPYAGGANVIIANQGTLLRTGFTFTGWNTLADGTGTAFAAGATLSNISANTTLYAQWTINTYTVTYDGNGSDGGTAPVDGASPYNFGANVTVLAAGSLTRTNYNFTGWNTAADGSGIAYTAGATITAIASDITLYAQWTIITYTITYNGNTNTGGTAPTDPSSPYAVGSNVTVLTQGTLVKTGYSFAGWNTLANGTGTPYAAGATLNAIASNTTLFAQWTINSYTVTYNGNGNTSGTAPVDPSSPYTFGTVVTVLANTGNLDKTGAVFVGWSVNADGSGTTYAATGAATFTLGAANVILYAKWAEPLYESFNYTSGGNVGGSTTGSGTTNNNWTTHNNSTAGTIAVSSPGLTYPGLQTGVGNKITIPGANSTTGRDINRSAGLTAAQNTTYFSFLLNIPNATQLGATFGTGGNGYFMHLATTTGALASNFTAKVHARSSNTAANFRLGISETGNTPAEATGDLNFNTTYLVVVKYVYNNTPGNDVATMWVNPTSLGGAEPSGGVNGPGSVNVGSYNSINTAIAIRNASATPRADIDEIRIGTTWAQVTPAVTYQLTTNAATGGTITAPATSPATVNQGAATTITAVANSGYIFTNWTVSSGTVTFGDANSSSTTATLTSGDATIQANFAINNVEVIASAGANGSISPSGTQSIPAGTSPTFTFTPAPCYQVADVIVDGVSQGALPDYTFTNITANATIEVTFALSTFTQWTGAVSTDWNDAANWSGCVPDATKYTYIPGIGGAVTRQPVLTSNVSVSDLEMGTDATLGLNGNTLSISSSYADGGNASIIGSATSSIEINGTNGANFVTLSSANPIALKNLTVSGGTLTLASTVLITGGTAPATAGVVTVADGAILEANGFLTLQSNQFGTARIAPSTSTSPYITGDVTVERYIPANTLRAWRLLAVPTKGSQTIKQSWQEGQAQLANGTPGYGTIITANISSSAALLGAGFDAFTTSPSMQRYGTGAWVNVTNTNVAIESDKAYFLYIRGSRAITPSTATTAVDATTLRTTGTLYQGPVTVNTAGSFTPIANVYASAVDFTQLTRSGVSNTYYLWDAKKASGVILGAYQTFSGTNGFQCIPGGGSFTPGQANTTIQSGQGFFVAGTGSVTFNESAKVSGSSLAGYRPATPVSALVKIDSRLYNNNNSLVDANVVVFNNNYANAVDADDAVKYTNPAENFGIVTNNTKLAVEGRKPITADDVINFNVSNLKEQTYTLEFTAANMSNSNLAAQLVDKYLGTSTPVDIAGVTKVSFTVDANAGSKAADRFSLVFKVKPTVPTITKAGIVVSPNPVEGSSMNLQFANQAAGKYTVRILNLQGKAITTAIVNHTGGSSNQVISLSSKVAAGMYKVEVISADKTRTVQSVFVK